MAKTKIIFQVLGVPRGFYPNEGFWSSLLDTEFPKNMKEIIFKFVRDSYFLPYHIGSIKNLLSVEIVFIECDD